MKGIVATLVVVSVLVPAPPRSVRADEVEFLDTRPIVIDLDTADVGDRWRVPVLDDQPGTGHRLALHLVFQPADVFGAADVVRTGNQGDVLDFVVQLRDRSEGSGELVVVSGGSIARRSISTVFGGRTSAVSVSSLQFAGVRLVPLTAWVRTGALAVRDAPGAEPPGIPVPRRIGVMTSGRGDTADVVRTGDEFFIQGADRTGEYTGSVDLAPNRPGGEAQATLRVRDLFVWPLLVLLLGLVIVHLLDRYQNRLRPRRLLELRLARLRDRARAIERETDLAWRVCALPGEPGLVLDTLVADALATTGPAMTEAEAADWEPDGVQFRRLVGLVDAFGELAERHRLLAGERARAEASFAPADRDRGRAALAESRLHVATRGRALMSALELKDAADELAAAVAYVRGFQEVYRAVARIRDTAPPDLRTDADRILAKLFAPPDDLDGLRAEVADLHRRWRPEPRPPSPGQVPYDIAPAPSVLPAPASRAPASRRGRRLAVGVATGVAAAALLFGSVTVEANLDANAPAPTPTAGVGSTPTVAVGGTRTPPATPMPPVAPVAVSPLPPLAAGFHPSEPTVGRLLLSGVVLPLVVAGVLVLVGWRVTRSWRRRRVPGRLTDLDTGAIDRELRVEGLRFAVVSGALVVLSGMSVLYVGNATFGSLGDYLAIALWGTVLGQGLNLARRLWPGGSGTPTTT
jgi:hypothetical protein